MEAPLLWDSKKVETLFASLSLFLRIVGPVAFLEGLKVLMASSQCFAVFDPIVSRLLKFGGTNKPASFSARNSPDFDRLVTDIGGQDAIFAPFE
ncbi:MAG: hypothetical protein AB7I18_14960, partial [Candidatus Berkiella sp.]